MLPIPITSFCFGHTIAQFSRILRFSHIYCKIFRISWRKWCTTALTSMIGSEKFQKLKFIFLELFWPFRWSCSGMSLPSKILKFWWTELSYAQNKNRGRKMRLLGMDTCPSLNDIMEIRCNKCTRSEQGYEKEMK